MTDGPGANSRTKNQTKEFPFPRAHERYSHKEGKVAPPTGRPLTSITPKTPSTYPISHGIHRALCSARVRKCMWAKVPFWREVFLFGSAIYTDFACKCKWVCGYKYEFILLRQPSIISLVLQLGCTRTFERAWRESNRTRLSRFDLPFIAMRGSTWYYDSEKKNIWTLWLQKYILEISSIFLYLS